MPIATNLIAIGPQVAINASEPFAATLTRLDVFLRFRSRRFAGNGRQAVPKGIGWN
jgi:hypothetical protein